MRRFLAPCLLCIALLAAPVSALRAQDLQAAEAAFKRHDHAALVKLLLPAYRNGELSDARGLYLLSRGCYFQKPPAIKLPFIKHHNACRKESGRITQAAAKAGDVDAMLDLAYTLFEPDRYTAHPDLRPDTAEAYRWALLAGSVAGRGDQRSADADAKIEKLWQALWHESGERVMPVPRAVEAEAKARADFLRLAAKLGATLAPGDVEVTDITEFRRLGWVEIPGTDAFEFDKEGMDSLYALTLLRQGDTVRFDVDLNQVDAWRFARIEARCGTTRAHVLRDTGWQNEEAAEAAAYHAVKPRPWKADRNYLRTVIEFACAFHPAAKSQASKPSGT